MTLPYTTEPPKEPGWYWRRPIEPRSCGGTIVHVFREDGIMKYFYEVGGEYKHDVDDAWWSGPIPEPDRPEDAG